MSGPDTDATELLCQARHRAEVLLGALQRQQAELAEVVPDGLETGQVTAGRQAVGNAIAAVQRLLNNLAGIPGVSSHGGESPPPGG